MRWMYFVVLAGFAGCGADDGNLFSGSSSSSSSGGGDGAGGSSSSTSVSSSSSSSSGGDAGAGGSSSSSSSSSSSGATCVCPPYQDCKDGTTTCWGCTKNQTQCLFYAPKLQGVECDDGFVPPAADCTYIGKQPEFPFKPLYCCLPK
jgi:hypothetical protein